MQSAGRRKYPDRVDEHAPCRRLPNVRLLNEFQRSFPLEPEPFAKMGERLGMSEDDVVRGLEQLLTVGAISRVGPVFAPGAIGVSTLAAMAVPVSRVGEVARRISELSEVNHNYEREGALNLWFVITAEDDAHLQATLSRIADEVGLPVHDLRLEEEFRIDLGFDLEADHLRSGIEPADRDEALS